MEELAEAADPIADRQTLICQALGLDPAEIDGVSLQFGPGQPVAIWAGRRELTHEEFTAIITQVGPMPAPETPEPPA